MYKYDETRNFTYLDKIKINYGQFIQLTSYKSDSIF